LKIHSGQTGVLTRDGAKRPRKLDFLLQENESGNQHHSFENQRRGGAAMKIHGLALASKAAIDKIREQSLHSSTEPE